MILFDKGGQEFFMKAVLCLDQPGGKPGGILVALFDDILERSFQYLLASVFSGLRGINDILKNDLALVSAFNI